jgi:hypothetical protein
MEFATVLFAMALFLHLAIAVVLIRKYLRTHDVGLIWLGIAVVVWPLVSGMLDLGSRSLIDRLVHHESVGFYPFSLVSSGQITTGELVLYLGLFGQVVGVCLLFVAVLYLANTRNPIQTHH